MPANILVVEDDRVGRNLICEVLRNEGYQIFEVGNGAEALELVYAHSFDLMITDFVMPKLNGLKLVEQLHRLQPRLPIIVITGYLSITSRKNIRKRGRGSYEALWAWCSTVNCPAPPDQFSRMLTAYYRR